MEGTTHTRRTSRLIFASVPLTDCFPKHESVPSTGVWLFLFVILEQILMHADDRGVSWAKSSRFSSTRKERNRKYSLVRDLLFLSLWLWEYEMVRRRNWEIQLPERWNVKNSNFILLYFYSRKRLKIGAKWNEVPLTFWQCWSLIRKIKETP